MKHSFRWSKKKLKNVGLLILAAIIFQFIYWSLYFYSNGSSPVPREQVITEFSVAEIATPTLSAAQAADYTAHKVFWRGSIEPPKYLAFKGIFDTPENLDYDIGMGAAFFVDNYALYVNGFLVSAHGRLEVPSTYHGKRREIVRVSRGLLRKGTNEVIAIGVQNDTRDIAVSAMLIGNYTKIMDATKRKRFMFNQYKWITIIVSALLALLCLLLLPRTRNKTLLLWLFALASAICLRISNSIYFGSLGGGANREFIYHAINAMIPVAWLGFVNVWCETPVLKRVQRLAIFAYFAMLVIFALLIFAGGETGIYYTQTVSDIAGFVLMLGAAARLVWHVTKSHEPRYWEFGILALGISLTLTDWTSFLFFRTDPGHSNKIGLIILVGLVGGILGRSIRVFESLGSLNDELQSRLAKREAEIESRYAELELTRRQRDIANERQRILRDMHDGIGAQLVVLLSAARSGELKPDALELAITQSLSDLRLMIDSLDSVSSDFAVALGTFRMRILPKLEAAGYTFNWDLDRLPLGVNVSSKTVLNIYRIQQEAIANVIRHADANTISIRVFPSQNNQRRNAYDIEIKDNGKGLTSNRESKGHGLANMNKRAKEIGAFLDIVNNHDGLTIIISGIETGSCTAASAPADLEPQN